MKLFWSFIKVNDKVRRTWRTARQTDGQRERTVTCTCKITLGFEMALMLSLKGRQKHKKKTILWSVKLSQWQKNLYKSILQPEKKNNTIFSDNSIFIDICQWVAVKAKYSSRKPNNLRPTLSYSRSWRSENSPYWMQRKFSRWVICLSSL